MSLVVQATSGWRGSSAGRRRRPGRPRPTSRTRSTSSTRTARSSSVLSCAPAMYDDLWVGGKCMYKLEPVVADGGELIIYAPHIKEISVTHGALIERIGYHVRDYFRQADGPVRATSRRGSSRTRRTSRASARTKTEWRTRGSTSSSPPASRRRSAGRSTSATAIRRRSVRRSGRTGKTKGILHVPKAGEILYRLRNDPFDPNRWIDQASTQHRDPRPLA